MLPRTLLRAPRRVITPTNSILRFYATQPSHPEPQTPPKPKNFFRKEKIGLEVTPLFALIGTIVIIATGAIVRNIVTDPDIHSRHGVEVDDKLKKVLEMPEGQGEKKESKEKK
ncbi:uncharacterized protein JCM6883_002612 [Sporobolomyces salmoneus]|uniref:uncharacterized protein n=1 Tax=Sporobolomyces salmoneus TaxID=183962 RepID=UPI003171119E